MMKQFGWVVVASLVLMQQANASGMRCGTKLVSLGDDFDEVTSKCGSPDSSYTIGTKVVQAYNPSTGQYDYDADTSTYRQEFKEVQVEVWVYDQGSNKFRKKLTFENGVLVSVESGSRH